MTIAAKAQAKHLSVLSVIFQSVSKSTPFFIFTKLLGVTPNLNQVPDLEGT